MSSDLKPCPFCGGAARAFRRTCDKNTPYDPADRAFPIVRCGACGACSEGDDWTGRQTAIDKWNRRAQPAQAVPPGYVLVPLDVLQAASESLGSFVSDNGWTVLDMQAMDNIDAILAQQKGQQP